MVITSTSTTTSTNANANTNTTSTNDKKLILLSISILLVSVLYKITDSTTYDDYINSIGSISINSINNMITPKLSSSVYHPSIGVIWYLEALVFPEFREYFSVLCTRYTTTNATSSTTTNDYTQCIIINSNTIAYKTT